VEHGLLLALELLLMGDHLLLLLVLLVHLFCALLVLLPLIQPRQTQTDIFISKRRMNVEDICSLLPSKRDTLWLKWLREKQLLDK